MNTNTVHGDEENSLEWYVQTPAESIDIMKNNVSPLWTSLLFVSQVLYCIAGKLGRELNLAVWRYAFKPPN